MMFLEFLNSPLRVAAGAFLATASTLFLLAGSFAAPALA